MTPEEISSWTDEHTDILITILRNHSCRRITNKRRISPFHRGRYYVECQSAYYPHCSDTTDHHSSNTNTYQLTIHTQYLHCQSAALFSLFLLFVIYFKQCIHNTHLTAWQNQTQCEQLVNALFFGSQCLHAIHRCHLLGIPRRDKDAVTLTQTDKLLSSTSAHALTMLDKNELHYTTQTARVFTLALSFSSTQRQSSNKLHVGSTHTSTVELYCLLNKLVFVWSLVNLCKWCFFNTRA